MTTVSSSKQSNSLVRLLFQSTTVDPMPLQVLWLVIRVSAGGLMIHNGLDKLANVQGFADNVVTYIGFPYPVFLTYCAAYTEVVGAILLMLGFLTRLDAAALLITMLVAIFFHVKGNGFKVTPLETAALYASFYLFFLINGGGKFAIDTWLWQQLNSKTD
ncbi:DoxX family protein [Oscillatoria sp. CS-180]|uniref:DoxX family protein n=1 Tax=Oscillatoria sp. CS-180 TaxID=3021720 RepID=UPI00232C8336|nr:DoxX family protein [Oscillatoria sp. CS-180]MDB9529314.1 DoxX family protein [Oscillatoria sp. CS-180]